jgi:hypothetical protein
MHGSWSGNDARVQAGFDGFICVLSKVAGYVVERGKLVNAHARTTSQVDLRGVVRV